MRYTITKCPNTEQVNEACKTLRPAGYHQRRRGRGCRFNRVSWWQSLPLSHAAYFTLYGEPAADTWRDRDHSAFIRAEFIRLEKNGKPRLKLLTPPPKPDQQKQRFAVEIERFAGMTVQGHFFDYTRALMKADGEIRTYERREDAEAAADHYTKQHAEDKHAICRKVYRVVTITK